MVFNSNEQLINVEGRLINRRKLNQSFHRRAMQGTELYLQKLDKSFKIISQTEARAMKGAVLVLQPDQLR
jgi:hypothetical protein